MDASTIGASAFRSGGSITLESRGDLDVRDSGLSATSELGLAGTIDLKAGASIDLTDTNVVVSAIFGGVSGSITMAAPIISLSGSTLDVGTNFEAGMISLSATRSVSLSKGTLFSADSPLTSAGTILINGGNLFTAQQSTVLARSRFGGTIHVQAKRVTLTDSVLNTFDFTEFGTGGGGHITIDAKNTKLTNSQILSTTGSGNEGTIDITSPSLHQDASSVIDADTVTINGVIQP